MARQELAADDPGHPAVVDATVHDLGIAVDAQSRLVPQVTSGTIWIVLFTLAGGKSSAADVGSMRLDFNSPEPQTPRWATSGPGLAIPRHAASLSGPTGASRWPLEQRGRAAHSSQHDQVGLAPGDCWSCDRICARGARGHGLVQRVPARAGQSRRACRGSASHDRTRAALPGGVSRPVHRQPCQGNPGRPPRARPRSARVRVPGSAAESLARQRGAAPHHVVAAEAPTRHPPSMLRWTCHGTGAKSDSGTKWRGPSSGSRRRPRHRALAVALASLLVPLVAGSAAAAPGNRPAVVVTAGTPTGGSVTITAAVNRGTSDLASCSYVISPAAVRRHAKARCPPTARRPATIRSPCPARPRAPTPSPSPSG